MTNAPSLRASMLIGLQKSFVSVLALAKVMVPMYVGMDLLKGTWLLDAAARSIAPAMSFVGLPGEASVVLLAGNVINLYAALGALGPLGLGSREVTILGLMLGISHSLPVETAIMRQVGTRWVLLGVIRVFLAALAGLVVHRVLP